MSLNDLPLKASTPFEASPLNQTPDSLVREPTRPFHVSELGHMPEPLTIDSHRVRDRSGKTEALRRGKHKADASAILGRLNDLPIESYFIDKHSGDLLLSCGFLLNTASLNLRYSNRR